MRFVAVYVFVDLSIRQADKLTVVT